jgi:hypothetical protein
MCGQNAGLIWNSKANRGPVLELDPILKQMTTAIYYYSIYDYISQGDFLSFRIFA